MNDPKFRGLVLGSPWRPVYGFEQLDTLSNLMRLPERDLYVWQPWAIDAMVRRSLLYFDKLTLPTNPILPTGIFLGAEMLGAEGEIEFAHPPNQPPIDPQWVDHLRKMALTSPLGGDAGKLAAAYSDFHRRVFSIKKDSEPGLWSYATVGEGIELDADQMAHGCAVELYNCLPMPLATASYSDIIEFKKHERTALTDLRGSLDEAYIRIANCADMDFVATKEVAKLRQSLGSVYTLMNKATLPWSPQTVSVEFKPDQLLFAATTGLGAYRKLAKIGVSHFLAIAGGAAAGLALQAAMLVKMKDFKSPANRAGELKYVYKAGMGGIVDPTGPAEDDAPASFMPQPTDTPQSGAHVASKITEISQPWCP